MSTALDRLVTMHAYCRPAGSLTERLFIERYIQSIGADADGCRNWSLVIGDNPRHVWSSHTDTVHRKEGSQRVNLNKRSILSSRGSCLGADDTTGVWLMCELARRRVPGRYVWHYGEEEGCIGSRELVASSPEWLSDIDMVIALDRKDTRDVITHQMGYRTASDDFSAALADQLNAGDVRLNYAPSDRGLYTDSESYACIVPECTNLSIGYQGNHSSRETLDTRHALALLERLTYLDIAALPVDRVPIPDNRYWGYDTVSVNEWDYLTYPAATADKSIVIPWSRECFWCRDCGESCSEFQSVCWSCGCDDPTGDDPIGQSAYLDPVFSRVQSELRRQVKRGIK